MPSLIVLALVGLLAQLIDGSLGMAYGVTSSTLLLAVGLSPVTASASVHLAEVGTTLASGASHARFGNVDWPTVRRLGVPGAIGAFVGANVLVGLSTAAARPVSAGILITIGVYLMIRFAKRPAPSVVRTGSLRARFMTPLGLVAGFVDATGGGGWGPVATPSLLLADRLPPRKVIGTVDTSEFLVSFAASAGFLLSLGTSALDMRIVVALLLGGLVAAPVAAWLVRKVDAQLLGASVGGMLVLTNARTLLLVVEASGDVQLVVYTVVFVAWARSIQEARRHRGLRASEHSKPPLDTAETQSVVS